jgi:WD40 repeat protein
MSALAALAAVFAATAGVMAWSSQKQARRAERGESEAERAQAAALFEAAAGAAARGAVAEARAHLRSGLERGDDPRGRVLWASLEREPKVGSLALGSGLFGAAISPRGDLFAAGAQDHTVYLIDAQTWSVRSLRGHQDQVFKVSFSPDGARLASSSWSGEIRLWDLQRGGGRILRSANGKGVGALAFDPAVDRLFAADLQGPVRSWPLDGGEPTVISERSAADLCFDAQGGVWLAHPDGHLRGYDRHSGALQHDLAIDPAPATSVALSADQRRFAIGLADGRIVVTDRAGGPIQILAGHRGRVIRVRFADAVRVVSIAEDKSARLWGADGRSLPLGEAHNTLWGLDLTPDGGGALLASVDGRLERWDLDRLAAAPRGEPHHDGATSVAFGEGELFSGGYDRAIRIWDLASGAPRGAWLAHQGTVYGLARRGDLLASASHDRTVRLWSIAGGVPTATLLGHQAGVYAVAIDPRGALLASAGADHRVQSWSLPDGAAGPVLADHGAPVFSLAWSPSGDRLASAGAGKVIVLSDRSGRVAGRLEGHQASVWGLAFDPSGARLASGGYDQTVRIWDLGRGEGRVLARLDARIYSLAFAPTGDRLLAAAADGRVHEIGLADGERRAFAGHRAEVNQIRIRADGRYAASASDDGTVRLWDLASGAPAWRTAGPPAGGVIIDRRGGWSCASTTEGRLELWEGDHRWFSAPEGPVVELRVFQGGCLALVGGVARLFDRAGAGRELASGAGAIEIESSGGLAVAAGDRLLRFDPTGAAIDQAPIEPGVTALARIDGAWVFGFRNGRVELGSISLASTPGGPVVRLAEGPMGTLLGGWASGELGIWSRDNGALLDRRRLHGPIVQLGVEGGRLWAHSELGGWYQDPDTFGLDYCTLMRRIWSQVPVVWRNGLPVRSPPPEEHPCRAR